MRTRIIVLLALFAIGGCATQKDAFVTADINALSGPAVIENLSSTARGTAEALIKARRFAIEYRGELLVVGVFEEVNGELRARRTYGSACIDTDSKQLTIRSLGDGITLDCQSHKDGDRRYFRFARVTGEGGIGFASFAHDYIYKQEPSIYDAGLNRFPSLRNTGELAISERPATLVLGARVP